MLFYQLSIKHDSGTGFIKNMFLRQTLIIYTLAPKLQHIKIHVPLSQTEHNIKIMIKV